MKNNPATRQNICATCYEPYKAELREGVWVKLEMDGSIHACAKDRAGPPLHTDTRENS